MPSKRLKRRGYLAHIPAVALTAHAIPSDRDRAQLSGFDEHEIKPAEIAVLLRRFDTLSAQESMA
jgi:CheY-like chemotaxis protein